MIPNDTPAPGEPELAPIDPPSQTIAIPAAVSPDECRQQEDLTLRLERLFADVPLDPDEVEEAARESGVDLGRLARRLRARVEEVHLRGSDAAAQDGRAEERPLAADPSLPRAVAHFAELSRQLLADRAEELTRRARGTPSRIRRSAIASTDPGQGAKV